MKRTLPHSIDEVSGMRAARWFRESTAGQWDNFGPDAQREQQDRAAAAKAGGETSTAVSATGAGRAAAARCRSGPGTGRRCCPACCCPAP